MRVIKNIYNGIGLVSEWSGRVARWVVLMLMVAITYEVVVRYVFNAPTIWAFDVSYMLYAILCSLGFAYVYYHGGNVRVDIIYVRFSPKGKLIIDVVFTLIFFSPLYFMLTTMPAIALIDKIMSKTSYEDVIEYLRIVNQRYLAEGVTSSSDAGVGLQSSDWPRIIGAYQEAVETGVLNIRCNLQVWHEIFLDYSHIDEELQEIDSRLFRLGIRSGLGDEKLRIGPIKIIMDGGVSLGTAATYEPYGAQPENQGTGILTMEPELLTRIVSALHYRGWQMSIHAIGDRAVDVVLNAYEAALREQPRANHHHHIEHCIIMNVAQMTRMKKLGVLCVTQPHFIWAAGDSFAHQLGKQRAEETLRFRTMLDKSLFTVFSSDRPATSGAPLLGIHAAVNRKTKSGENYGLGETISAEEALRLYTINGAYTTFEEGIKGSIETGKLADLVVLAEDPTKGDPERVKDIPVVATMVGGEVVYEK